MFHLDLKDTVRVVDFLVQSVPFVDPKQRVKADALIKDYHDSKRLVRDDLIEVARELAAASWPARYAMERYFKQAGNDEEWRRVMAEVRPKTAQALAKLRRQAEGVSLAEVLARSETGALLDDETSLEIDEVRRAMREVFWREKGAMLTQLVKDGENELEGYKKRFERLRGLASQLPPLLQDEIFSKIAYYEDRILFAGQVVALEVLDEEVKYYTDQAVSSPLEG